MALSGLGAVASPRLDALHPSEVKPSKRALVKPKVLRTGDTIGMPAPASNAFDPDRIRLAKEQIEALGFRVRMGEYVFEKHGYFAGTDDQRAADVNAMFADDEVDGIFFYTGGWGAPRILPLLDFDLIRANPKVIMGYSDITSLLYPIHQETGLVTFHGPVAASNIRPWTRAQMERVIMSTEPIGTLGNPEKAPDELVERFYRTITIRPGRATGRLTGGNLTLISVLMGTPWEIDTDGAILFLEDIHEGMYRVDRMLTQLALAGKLDRLAGVAFGFCTDCSVGEGIGFSLEEILRQHLEPLGVPVMSGLAFGHIQQQLTLPIGMPATIDTEAGTLTIDSAAVVT